MVPGTLKVQKTKQSVQKRQNRMCGKQWCGKSANTGIFPGSFLKMLLEVEGSILRMFCVNVAVI